MSYQVLARKWRPQNFTEVIGQQHIVRSLQNVILSDRPGNAYLFSGTRGVGKTTVARIFARALRCEDRRDPSPCNKCFSCQESRSSMNILEMDGASQNSVDNIRDLVDNVQYLPTSGKYKIYIIDEVHMLSSSAFNALLKTLEEPPAHVVFILATTVPEKLLDTVVSRCLHFDFRKVPLNILKNYFKETAQKENIVFSDDKLIDRICRQSGGSIRDGLSLLEQVLNYAPDKKIDERILASALGLAKPAMIDKLLSAVLSGDSTNCSVIFRTLIRENVALENILSSLLEALFEMIEKGRQKKDQFSMAELLWIFETLAKDSEWTVNSPHPEMVTEIALQKLSL
ncbi:MAG: DNA polymerase III subunit gamma/tau, partial [Halobacteriovoraceae bacterium]|nr:DNA polymerase III subunit gamma/tau [Halobacteriovoraceae bacterium]